MEPQEITGSSTLGRRERAFSVAANFRGVAEMSLLRETHLNPGVQSFYKGQVVWTHPATWPAMIIETPEPNNEVRCTSSILMFAQNSPNKLLWHSSLLQKIICIIIKSLQRTTVSGLAKNTQFPWRITTAFRGDAQILPIRPAV